MPTYNLDTLDAVFKKHWRPGWGSIARDEVLFVQELLEQNRPKNFLEIGMASGLSGGLLASILENTGGETFSSIDYDNTFFGDPSRENGFLINEIYSGSKVTVTKHPFTTSLDLAGLNKEFDMAFIDANHQHPWPTIDTLCLLPYMTGEKIIIHHDLKLFKNQDTVYGIGPKYLHDQFHPKHRISSEANQGNIYALRLDNVDIDYMVHVAINCFSMPWTLRHPLSDKDIQRVQALLQNHYSQELATAFVKCASKFNQLERLRTGV